MHEYTNRFKTVHASQAIAARGRSPALSYTASTRIIDGVPLRRFNILCCILIAVVVSATLGAIPLTNIERQRFDNMPAIGAQLTRREKSVNELSSLPIPFAFIRKHASKHTHPDICYGTSKTVVGHHAANIQVFNANNIKSPHKVCSELVKIIRPTVANMFMQPSNFDALPLPSSAALLPPCENALHPCQLGEITPKMFRACNAFPVRKGSQPVNAKVNANSLSGFWQLDNSFIEAECNKVFPRRFLDYRNRCRFALKISTPMDVESSQARKNEVLVELIPLEGTTGVFGRLPISFFLVCGVSASFRPEVEKSCLQVTKRLLSWYRGYVIQPYCGLLFFKVSEHLRSIVVADSFLFGSPSLRPEMECPIIDISAATENSGEFLGLGIGRIESKAVSCFHTINIHCVR